MQLSPRQTRFILAAWQASGQGKNRFNHVEVGKSLGADEDESRALLFGLNGIFLVTRGWQEFTDAGSEVARELMDLLPKTVRADQLKQRVQPAHAKLSPKQTKRAMSLWSRIGQYIGTRKTAEQWMNNFRYDQHPDDEIQVWEGIARAFEAVGGPSLPEMRRKQVLKGVILISTGGVDVESQTGLTEDEVVRLRAAYGSTP